MHLSHKAIPNIPSDVLLANFSNCAVYAFHGYMRANAEQLNERLMSAGLGALLGPEPEKCLARLFKLQSDIV